MAYRRRKRSSRRTCVKRKRVRVKGQGYAYRCAKYRGKGKRPFNKGKHCRHYGVNRRGKRVCRDYGARPRVSRRRAQGPMTSRGTFYSHGVKAVGPSWIMY